MIHDSIFGGERTGREPSVRGEPFTLGVSPVLRSFVSRFAHVYFVFDAMGAVAVKFFSLFFFCAKGAYSLAPACEGKSCPVLYCSSSGKQKAGLAATRYLRTRFMFFSPAVVHVDRRC